VSVRSSEILRWISGVFSSGISTGEKPSGLGLPSRAQRARRRTESLSPRLMLSSLLEVDRTGRETPMTSAESLRVERDEQRRWWDPRFAAAEVELSCDREEMEPEDESETS
jgi:siroheme synthase (precorrin-2 oxidase/ferrochelatase)